MLPEKNANPKKNSPVSTQNIILFMIGIGLILVSVAVFLAIPKAQAEVLTNNTSAQPMAVNYPAPDVRLTDLQNNPVALADFRGKIVLYNAWATWCPPCKAEMPTLEAYFQQHQQDGFVVVAIEDGEPAAEVAEFARSKGLTFPVWPDPKWAATTAFKTDILPSSFVIDRNGQVVLSWQGPISRETLEKFVTPLIQQ